MVDRQDSQLSRREREMMDIIYERGRAAAADVQTAMEDPPSYSAVRATLRVLEEKGHLRHEQDGPRYVYVPMVPRDEARQCALKHMLKTFFDGSVQGAVAALLDLDSSSLSPDELSRLQNLIDDARKEGR